LSQLSDEQQTILVLRFVERKSHEEVAQVLGKSIDAIATAQHRALKRLAELMGTEKSSRHYLRGRLR
jgi:RNA polymerase sigma factor (sigma-70 family)